MKRVRALSEGSTSGDDALGLPHDGFGLHAGEYEQAVDQSISFTGRNASFFAQRKVDLLRRLLQTHGRDLSRSKVLDVGCGTGTTDRHLVDHVEVLHGVDISADMVAVAERTVTGANFDSYDGKTLPFPAGSFDVVIAICVLHHVPELDQGHFVEELHRVTRSGGFIAIFEHNPANPLTRRAVNACDLDEGVVLLSPSDVESLFAKADLSVLAREYFLVSPLGGRLGSALDRPFRRLPLGGQFVSVAEAFHDLSPVSG
jgi:ubiquinone/menaquinone biosynthesis C-methylase UbiE